MGVITHKKWCAIKEVSHPPSCTTICISGEEDNLAHLLCNFFADKVVKIRSAIDQRLRGKQPDPISADKPFVRKSLSGLKPVLHTAVKQMLDAMTGKSSLRFSF